MPTPARSSSKLTAIDGVERVFDRPVFHEAVVRLDVPVADTAARAGGARHPRRLQPDRAITRNSGSALLVCATETRTTADIEQYASCTWNAS